MDPSSSKYKALEYLPKEIQLQVYGSFLAEVVMQFMAEKDLTDKIDPNHEYTVPEILAIMKEKYPTYRQDLSKLIVAKQHELEQALEDGVTKNQ